MVYQPVQQIDFPSLFSTIANLRQAKLQQQVGQLQLADMYEARDRRHAIENALRNGDIEAYARLDPMGYAKLQQTGLDTQKTRSEIANTQSQIADRQRQAEQARAEMTQKVQQNMARALEARPDAAPQLQARIDAMASGDNPTINHFTLPGREEQMSPGIEGPPGYVPPTQQEISTLGASAGIEDPYAKPAAAVAEFAQLTGRRPGPSDPNFKADFDAWDLSRRRAGATTINNLPASQVNEISDLRTAQDSVDSLLTEFKKSVQSKTFGDQMAARGEKYIPNTDIAQYNNSANVTAQAVGIILEGGKLSEADLPRYKAMLPQPGDSVDTAEKKARKIKELLHLKEANRVQGLGATGYRTPGARQQQPPGGMSDAQMRQAFNRLLQQSGGR